MDILEKTLDYLNNELDEFKNFISRQTIAPSIPSREDEKALIDRAANSTLDMGMGAIMLAQELGVKYDDIIQPYREFKYAIRRLAINGKRGIE